MKRIFMMLLVLALLGLSAVPAFASGGPPSDRLTSNGSCTGSQVNASSRLQANSIKSQQADSIIQTPYALSGTITAIDPNSRAIDVAVACGNWMIQPYHGNSVTVQTTSSTRFLLRSQDGTATMITFADLEIGQSVSSHGTLVDGVFTASRITSGALLSCQP